MEPLFATAYRELERATATPGLVVIHGPRGVGKTTLLRLFEANEAAGERRVPLVLLDASTIDEVLVTRARTEAIVITSRSRPRQAGLRRIALGAFPVPEPGSSLEELATHPTVLWFWRQAVSDPAEAPARTDLRLTAEIVQRLEGVPELLARAAERAARIGLAAVRQLLAAPFAIDSWYDERPTPLDPQGYRVSVRDRLLALPES
ncbi:MAG: ATP-binding protein, partial [Proteobacteria bacterium]